jgi:hypothetical protein
VACRHPLTFSQAANGSGRPAAAPAGLSLQRISNLLAELAVPARSGETRWPTKTLHRIVRDDLDDAGG